MTDIPERPASSANSWLTFFVSTLIGVFGIAVMLWIYFQQRDIKSLQIVVTDEISVLDADLLLIGEEEGIQVLFQGEPVSNLAILRIRIENNGNMEITKADYTLPVTLSFNSSVKVLNAVVMEKWPEDISASLSIDGQRIILSPTLLNPGDRIDLLFLLSGQSGDIRSSSFILSGRIVGVPSLSLEKGVGSRLLQLLLLVRQIALMELDIPYMIMLSALVVPVLAFWSLYMWLADKFTRKFQDKLKSWAQKK